MIKIIINLFFVLLLSSCTSLSENECASMNWYKKGMQDAKAGLPKSTLGEHKGTCLRFGIEFDKLEYIEGYEKALGKK